MNAQKVSFFEAVKLFFKNYTNFRTRSRRSEYWWVWLFCTVVSGVLAAVMPEIAGLWNLVVLVPNLSLAVRRLHDIGKSGWWYLLLFVPLVGAIIILIWACKDSVPEANQWGPNPKG